MLIFVLSVFLGADIHARREFPGLAEIVPALGRTTNVMSSATWRDGHRARGEFTQQVGIVSQPMVVRPVDVDNNET